MTMPNERGLSLQWAHELLASLEADSEVPEECRVAARVVRQNFPTPDALRALIRRNVERLPSEIAEAIEAARDLFVDIQISGSGTAATRQAVIYTMRHFPLPGAARRAARAIFPHGIKAWLVMDEA